MELALGKFGWTPRVFWESTPSEFWAAYYGHFGRMPKAKPLTMEEVRGWEKEIQERGRHRARIPSS